MPDPFTTQALLQALASSTGFAYTQHAMEPGASESTEYSQMVKAQAYWLSVLQAGGYVPAPVAPVPTTAVAASTMAAGTYGAIVSYVSAGGESIGSPSGSVVVPGPSTNTMTIPSPAASTGATSWYAYVTQANGSTFTRQQAVNSPTALGTNLVLSAPPTSSGTNPLTVDGSASFYYGKLALDAYNHLTARIAFFGNPAATPFFGGDRT